MPRVWHSKWTIQLPRKRVSESYNDMLTVRFGADELRSIATISNRWRYAIEEIQMNNAMLLFSTVDVNF